MHKIKLYCLPYAGGSAMVYSRWKKYLDPWIEMIPLELPGRGSRYKEPFYASIAAAVDGLFSDLKEDLKHESYAFFGHSMGSILAFELCHRLHVESWPLPRHVFFSARNPPHVTSTLNYENMTWSEFKQEILDLGGATEDLFTDPTMSEIFLPILLADFRIHEAYRYVHGNFKLDSDISVLYGNRDHKMSLNEMKHWADYTNGRCEFKEFTGGHFFIHEKMSEVIDFVNSQMRSSISQVG